MACYGTGLFRAILHMVRFGTDPFYAMSQPEPASMIKKRGPIAVRIAIGPLVAFGGVEWRKSALAETNPVPKRAKWRKSAPSQNEPFWDGVRCQAAK